MKFSDYLALRYPFYGYLREFHGDRWRVLLALILAMVKHTPVLILPIYIGYVIDSLIPAKDKVGLLLAMVGMGALIVMNMAMHPLFIRLYSKIRRSVALELRARLCRRIQSLVFAYHDRESSGRLHSKVMQDVEKLDRIGQILIDPLGVMIFSVIFAAAVVVYTQPLFLILFAIFVPVVLLQHKFTKKKIGEHFEQLRIEQEKLNAEVTEMLMMLPMTKAHATEAEDLKRISNRLDSVRNRGVGTDWLTNILQSQIWGSSQFVTIAVVIFGGFLVIQGRMTIGELVMFLSFVGMTIGGLSGVMSHLVGFYEGAEAMRSINEVMSYPDIEQFDGKPGVPPLIGQIEFRDVWFAYPGAGDPVLQSINLNVKPNQTIALVGASGAGKTTFVKLLLGFYQPIKGSICIDGHDLTEVDVRTFRRQVGIVTQDTFLFNGTVSQNLTHGLENMSMDDVCEAARQAYALDFIEKMDHGFETEIGDKGVRLSGGQKQRIAIARALLRKPRLLILDEATSALDSESERFVQKALENLMKGRTAVVIAHRLSTVRHADRILVFDEGNVVEDGDHEHLVLKKGVYAKLVELQSIA